MCCLFILLFSYSTSPFALFFDLKKTNRYCPSSWKTSMNAQGFLIYSDETEYDSIEESPRNRISIRKNFLLDVRDIYSSYNIEKLIGIFIHVSFPFSSSDLLFKVSTPFAIALRTKSNMKFYIRRP